jgi:putative iron-dependent peroxidase
VAEKKSPSIVAPTSKQPEAAGKAQSLPSPSDGSLGIGSLKKAAGSE